MKLQDRVILTIGIIVAIAGCTSSTGPGPLAMVMPGVGSTFTYRGWAIDTATGRMRPGSDGLGTITVIAAHISYQGKTNVLELQLDTFPPEYINYEPNGDLSIYFQAMGQPGAQDEWVTMPLVSGGQHKHVCSDITSASGERWRTVKTFTSAGPASITVSGHTYSSYGIGYQELYNSTLVDTSTTWYDAATGMYIQEDEPVQFEAGFKIEGHHVELVSETLK